MAVRKIFILFFLLCFSSTLYGDVAKDLENLLQSKEKKGVRLGVSVVDLDGKKIYEKNSKELFLPASNMKLITTAAALEFLGISHRFTTHIYATGNRAFGILQGNLWVVGSGDPLISERLYPDRPETLLLSFAYAIKNAGIHEIQGDLILDDRLFEDDGIFSDWPKDQLNRWYCAEISALSFNDNCIDITVGGSKIGQKAHVLLSPPTAYMRIRNLVVTTTEGASISVDRNENNEILLKGAISQKRKTTITITVHDPAMYFGKVFQECLKKAGVVFKGNLRRPQLGENRREGALLVEHQTLLRQSIPIINKRSQNLHAEILFKLIGQKEMGSGSFEGGQKAVEKYLQKAGFKDGFKIADGSGLSRSNRLSPELITSFLVWVKGRPYGTFYRNSLSLAGRDGTLRNRMKGPSTEGKVYAKTGTIDGVSALSGYGWSEKEQKWYVFSILSQGFSMEESKSMENQIVEIILENQ